MSNANRASGWSWRGRPIENLPRHELIEALHIFHEENRQLRETVYDQRLTIVDLKFKAEAPWYSRIFGL